MQKELYLIAKNMKKNVKDIILITKCTSISIN